MCIFDSFIDNSDQFLHPYVMDTVKISWEHNVYLMILVLRVHMLAYQSFQPCHNAKTWAVSVNWIRPCNMVESFGNQSMDSENKYNFSKWIVQNQEET